MRGLHIFCLAMLAPIWLWGQTPPGSALRVGIVGLVHGHAAGFLNGGALAPAGGALHRTDVQLVGVAEPDRALFDEYSKREHFRPELYYPSLEALVAGAHPEAVLVFTDTLDHTRVVEECARRHVHVMMEKPLAVSYRDALAMAKAAREGNIHVLVDYETTWYGSNKAARDLLVSGSLGEVRKVVVHDGHAGPKMIHVSPEFFGWLTDPKRNGAGALFDFGCYGADLMTWLMNGAAPESVTAVTQQLQPEVYPKVEDEANVIVRYPAAVALIQGSWNWPFDRKDLTIYGRTGMVQTVKRDGVEVRLKGQPKAETKTVPFPAAPEDDPLHFLAAVIRGQVSEKGTLSGLDTNVVATEILDAARQSAQSGATVKLPLPE